MSTASLIRDGEIIVAVQEEKDLQEKKHDSRFPINAIRYCLRSQNIDLRDIKFIIYYEKPLLTFEVLKLILELLPEDYGRLLQQCKSG